MSTGDPTPELGAVKRRAEEAAGQVSSLECLLSFHPLLPWTMLVRFECCAVEGWRSACVEGSSSNAPPPAKQPKYVQGEAEAAQSPLG